MTPVTPPLERYDGATKVIFRGGPGLIGNLDVADLAGLVYPDGVVLFEFSPTEEERRAILHGENIRVWLWSGTLHPRIYPMAVSVSEIEK